MSKIIKGYNLRNGFIPVYTGTINTAADGSGEQIGIITRLGDYVYININTSISWAKAYILSDTGNVEVFKPVDFSGIHILCGFYSPSGVSIGFGIKEYENGLCLEGEAIGQGSSLLGLTLGIMNAGYKAIPL